MGSRRPSGRRRLFRPPTGIAALAATPVLPEAALVGVLSAQLGRSRPRSTMSASRNPGHVGRRVIQPKASVGVLADQLKDMDATHPDPAWSPPHATRTKN